VNQLEPIARRRDLFVRVVHLGPLSRHKWPERGHLLSSQFEGVGKVWGECRHVCFGIRVSGSSLFPEVAIWSGVSGCWGVGFGVSGSSFLGFGL